jgi:hypothetical protein
MITFALRGYEGVDPAGIRRAESRIREARCSAIIVCSLRTKTKTPNQDRARALIGISNQGLFMPLVAAARPIKRISLTLPFRAQANPFGK